MCSLVSFPPPAPLLRPIRGFWKDSPLTSASPALGPAQATTLPSAGLSCHTVPCPPLRRGPRDTPASGFAISSAEDWAVIPRAARPPAALRPAAARITPAARRGFVTWYSTFSPPALPPCRRRGPLSPAPAAPPESNGFTNDCRASRAMPAGGVAFPATAPPSGGASAIIRLSATSPTPSPALPPAAPAALPAPPPAARPPRAAAFSRRHRALGPPPAPPPGPPAPPAPGAAPPPGPGGPAPPPPEPMASPPSFCQLPPPPPESGPGGPTQLRPPNLWV